MAYTNYVKLKETGDEGEQKFIEFLDQKGYQNIQVIDDVYEEEGLLTSDWDVRATNDLGIVITFEVKTQDRCHKFGWFNCEQVQNGKLGGIPVSKADYVVFYNPVLGFGIEEHKSFMKTHWEITKQASMIDYKRKKQLTMRNGLEVILWKTDFTNWAAGWRQKNNTINWYK